MTIRDNIQTLVEQGVCLIPVLEQEKGKTPAIKWRHLKEPIPLLGVFDYMLQFDTNTLAMVLGEPSSNLICLDVDAKYKEGIAGKVLGDFSELFPSVFQKLRIERTKSGGLHILWRISPVLDAPRSRDLAKRLSTQEEVALDEQEGRKVRKTRCFLELKAAGGLSNCFPSPGYVLERGEQIQQLSFDEHSNLITLCESYNEVFPVERIKPTVQQQEIYSTNPFEDFDLSPRGAEVLAENGWKYEYPRGEYLYYSKPDKKLKGVSASFNSVKRLYKIFTAGTDLEPKSYSPSNLVCEIQFGGNKKDLYAWLVFEGYGKLKPEVEQRMIRGAIMGNGELPKNISQEGRKGFEEASERLEKNYPHGIFWTEAREGYKISRESLLDVARELGFRVHRQEAVRIVGWRIFEFSEHGFYNELKKYISEDEDVAVFDAFETFIQNSGKFSILRLDQLEEDLVLESNKKVSYQFFRNGYLRIDSQEIELLPYEVDGVIVVQKLIWESKIKNREFHRDLGYEKGLYYDFLKKAIGVNDYLKKCIGFLSHDYRDTESYFILATEQVENPKDGAGAGKNVFFTLLSETTSVKSTAASMVKKDNQLLQSWNGERIFVLADIPRKFDYIFFKDIINGNAVVRKLYKDEYSVHVKDMCKLCGSTNYSYDDADPGIKRRIRAIEFTDFFTRSGGVRAHYNMMFPDGWNAEEYVWFDNFIAECIQELLKVECVIDLQDLTESGWIKQFKEKYSHLWDFIHENIEIWVKEFRIDNTHFKKEYLKFVDEYNVKNKGWSMQFVNQALVDYCDHYKIVYDKDVVWKMSGISFRGRSFTHLGTTQKTEGEEAPF